MRIERKNEVANQQIEGQIDAALYAVSQAEIPAGLAQRVALRMEASAKLASVAPKKNGFVWRFGLRTALGAAVAAALLMAAGLQVTLHSHKRKRETIAQQGERVRAAAFIAQNIPAPPKTAQIETKGRPKIQRPARHYELASYPLTHQERLLLQVARTVDPKEVQMLNPEYRAAQEAKEEAEFAAYVSEADKVSDQQDSSTPDSSMTTDISTTTEEGSTL